MDIDKKSTIFVQSSWNLLKMIFSRGNFTKSHEDWTKIVDFLLIADFEGVSFFFLGRYNMFKKHWLEIFYLPKSFMLYAHVGNL